MTAHDLSSPAVNLGLRANWQQFSLLVLINAFVGGMVGIERTVVPLIGSEEFHLASNTLIVSFIVSFGVIKACANLVSGHLADVWGRKRVLVIGWLLGLPVPFMIMWAQHWEWVVAANALLGINQGFAWSMTVIMKIDLVGPKSRGLAVGPQRVRRLSGGRHHRIPYRLHCRAIRSAPGSDLFGHCLRHPWRLALNTSGSRHARSCPPRNQEQPTGCVEPRLLGHFRPDIVSRPQSLCRIASRARQQSQ
jgi:predicted MFS family arabinose efflux permease